VRKFLFLILVSILMTGCSNDKSKSAADLSGGANQALYETQPSVTTQAQSLEEPLKLQYPQILTPASTDQIDYAVNSEGKFCIYDGRKYGFMDDKGNEITPYLYDYAYPFSEGLACVRLDGKYGFIDDKGNTVIQLTYDKASPFSEGLAYFAAGDRYGFIDKNGNVAFLLNCDSVSSFQEGLAYFYDGGKYGYIDEAGKVVIKARYDDAGYFQDGLAKVRVGLKLGVIDRNGTELVPADYDDISFDSGFIIAESGGKYGCFDKVGNLIFKPVYDSITMLPGKNSAVVYLEDQPEIIDFQGNIEVADKYDSIIYYDSEYGDAMIEVSINDKYGFLDMSDFSEVVSPVNDWLSLFKNGRAVVGNGNKYGVIDKTGNIVVPLNYDYAELFDNGTLALNQDGEFVLADADGKIINDNLYDSIEEIGSCYIIEAGGKYGLLDENGTEMVAPVYDYIPTGEYNSVYHSENCCVARIYGSESKDYIIEAGEDQETDLSRVLLQNEITPRIKPYNQYQKSGSINIPDSGDETMPISVADDMNACYKEFKLYDIDGNGNPVLYFYAGSLISPAMLSYSGLYSVKNGSLNELVSGYECGGTAGGDIVCFFKDTKTSKILIGDDNYAGGFMGSASGCDIYEYQNGEAKAVVSYKSIGQAAGNHEESDLVKSADLFYDKNGKPYNKDTILNADYVTEYWRDGKQVTVEEYNRDADRYEALLDFLL
jgi:hypothetical protein